MHDPKGMDVAKTLLKNVKWSDNAYDAMKGAEAVVIVTEWNDYKTMDLNRAKEVLARPIMVDLRNLFEPQEMLELGFLYSSVGRVTPGM